ncbi:MAG: GNAT family N-acetyltransferase [Paracoccaceae bacterium]
MHTISELPEKLLNAAETLAIGNMRQYAQRTALAQSEFASLKAATLRKPASQYHIWGTATRLNGFMQVESTGARSLHIMEMQVAPHAQGLGYGARMMAHILRHARICGLGNITLVCNAANTRAMAFYTDRQRFVPIARFEDAHWRAPQVELVLVCDELAR